MRKSFPFLLAAMILCLTACTGQKSAGLDEPDTVSFSRMQEESNPAADTQAVKTVTEPLELTPKDPRDTRNFLFYLNGNLFYLGEPFTKMLDAGFQAENLQQKIGQGEYVTVPLYNQKGERLLSVTIMNHKGRKQAIEQCDIAGISMEYPDYANTYSFSLVNHITFDTPFEQICSILGEFDYTNEKESGAKSYIYGTGYKSISFEYEEGKMKSIQLRDVTE